MYLCPLVYASKGWEERLAGMGLPFSLRWEGGARASPRPSPLTLPLSLPLNCFPAANRRHPGRQELIILLQ